MHRDPEACYRALAARDARFDGLFFVGVTSTGIYCRCICSARTPKRKNCTFLESPAHAERAGFRPCLLCRPELAPGRSRVDALGRLAETAARWIEDGALDERTLPELAAELGVGERHLRRAVKERFGVSPVELAQTHRLLSAKRLLTDTDLGVGEIAMLSGFGSVRRLNALFSARYNLSPTDLRRRRKLVDSTKITIELGFRPPYDFEAMLRFLERRAIMGVEQVEGASYRRSVRLGDRTGWIAVQRSKNRHALRVELDSSLAPVLPKLIRRLSRMFDTAAEPSAITEALGELAERWPGLRLLAGFDPWESLVRVVLGQQVSVAGASTLASRFAHSLGTPFDAGLLFPEPQTVARASTNEIAALGIVRKRAQTLIDMAQAIEQGDLDFGPRSDPLKFRHQILRIPGVGPWTAEMALMRACGHPDAWPESDLGIQRALPPGARPEAWRPWRSYAAQHLWQSLEVQP